MSQGSESFDAALTEQVLAGFEHLNDEHPDTVRFVARHVLKADVVRAQLAGVDEDGIRIVGWAEDTSELAGRIPFTVPPTSLVAVRGQLLAALQQSRGEVDASVPLTSFERQVRQAATQTAHLVRVERKRDLTPRLVELTLGGLSADFVSVGPAQFFLMVVPRAGSAATWMTPRLRRPDLDRLPPEEQPHAAYYTVRRYRPERGEIDVWVARHDGGGTVSAWAWLAEPGASLAVFGPRVGFVLPPDATRVLLLGDETALAAIAAILDDLPSEIPVDIVVDAPDEAYTVDFGSRDRTRVQWFFPRHRPAGVAFPLLDWLRTTDVGEHTCVFAACEASQARAIRGYLERELGRPPTHRRVTAYWRR